MLLLRTKKPIDYADYGGPRIFFHVRSGTVVRMLFPDDPNGLNPEHPSVDGKSGIYEKSLNCVGHSLLHGAKIVDSAGNPIQPKMVYVTEGGGNVTTCEIIDPGSQYVFVFDLRAPPQHAMVSRSRIQEQSTQ